jgi:hypothetical protein
MSARMSDDDALDALQTALLDRLAQKQPPAELRRALAADPAFAPYRAWVGGLDDGALEAAAALVAIWARRD